MVFEMEMDGVGCLWRGTGSGWGSLVLIVGWDGMGWEGGGGVGWFVCFGGSFILQTKIVRVGEGGG